MARSGVKKAIENQVTDDFIEDVEEELRHQRTLELWRKWGPPAILAAILLAVSVLGWTSYQYLQTKKLAENSDAFAAAVVQTADKNLAETQTVFAQLENNQAYALASTNYLIGKALDEDNIAEATKLYDTLIAKPDLQDSHRFMFILQAASLNIGNDAFNKYVPMLTNTASSSAEDNYYRYLALELLALNDYATGKADDAKTKMIEITQAPNIYPELRARASLMLDLLNNMNGQ